MNCTTLLRTLQIRVLFCQDLADIISTLLISYCHCRRLCCISYIGKMCLKHRVDRRHLLWIRALFSDNGWHTLVYMDGRTRVCV